MLTEQLDKTQTEHIQMLQEMKKVHAELKRVHTELGKRQNSENSKTLELQRAHTEQNRIT